MRFELLQYVIYRECSASDILDISAAVISVPLFVGYQYHCDKETFSTR